jgi:hypothetical protein
MYKIIPKLIKNIFLEIEVRVISNKLLMVKIDNEPTSASILLTSNLIKKIKLIIGIIAKQNMVIKFNRLKIRFKLQFVKEEIITIA